MRVFSVFAHNPEFRQFPLLVYYECNQGTGGGDCGPSRIFLAQVGEPLFLAGGKIVRVNLQADRIGEDCIGVVLIV